MNPTTDSTTQEPVQEKIAIVTGASEGIGFGIASALAARGDRVYLLARTPAKLEVARNNIVDRGGKAEIRAVDVRNFDAVKQIIDEVYSRHNRLDIFVNNAGAWKGQSLDTPFNEVRELFELDQLSPYAIAHYLASKFRKLSTNNLQILTVASQAALQVMDEGIGYGPAKMGLVAGLFHIDRELQREEVRNVTLYRLYPNTVATEKMMDAIRKNQVQNPVKLESVVDAAIDLLENATPTRDIRIGYYPGKGIVRTHLPSDPTEFYQPHGMTQEVVDASFTPRDLLS